MSRFADCLAFTLQIEGGYSLTPSDRGGATNCGITQVTYDAWRSSHGLATRPVAQIDAQEVPMVYRDVFWNPVRGDSLTPPLDLVVFDFGVNSSPARAIRYLQMACGAKPDGLFGPNTLAMVQKSNALSLASSILVMREKYYQSIVDNDPTQSKFLDGWDNRISELRKECGIT